MSAEPGGGARIRAVFFLYAKHNHQRAKDTYEKMNEADTAGDGINSQAAWFLTEASGFIGASAR